MARVDRKGKVTPVKKGAAVIRAKVSYKEDGRTMEKVLSYQLRILGKSTEYFKYKSIIIGLTSKGKKLKEVHIPGYMGKNKVSGVHADAFRNDKVVEKVYTPDNLVYFDYQDWEEDYYKSINFIGCTKLRELHLGKSLRGIGCQSDNSALEKITVDERNNYFQVRDNVLFSKKNTLELYPGGRKDVSYQIPAGIKKVQWHAFSGAKHLKHVVFPKGIENIALAFDNSGLVDVTIPESVKDSVSKSVKQIAGYAFEGQSYLQELSMNRVSTLGNHAFGNSALRKVTFSKNLKSLPLFAFKHCRKLKRVAIPDTIRSVADGAFKGCTSLKSVVVGNRVYLEKFVFEDCKNLRQVTFRRKIKNRNDADAYAHNETYKNAGSSNYRKLVVKVPGCSKKY